MVKLNYLCNNLEVVKYFTVENNNFLQGYYTNLNNAETIIHMQARKFHVMTINLRVDLTQHSAPKH